MALRPTSGTSVLPLAHASDQLRASSDSLQVFHYPHDVASVSLLAQSVSNTRPCTRFYLQDITSPDMFGAIIRCGLPTCRQKMKWSAPVHVSRGVTRPLYNLQTETMHNPAVNEELEYSTPSINTQY